MKKGNKIIDVVWFTLVTLIIHQSLQEMLIALRNIIARIFFETLISKYFSKHIECGAWYLSIQDVNGKCYKCA